MPRSVTKPSPENKPSPEKRARERYKTVPSRTVKDDPQLYTKVPHDYGELIRGNKLGGALQRDLVYWIERETWVRKRVKGEIVRPEFAKLSFGQLAKLCGGVERKNVVVAIADLERRRIIEARDRTGCGKTAARCTSSPGALDGAGLPQPGLISFSK